MQERGTVAPLSGEPAARPPAGGRRRLVVTLTVAAAIVALDQVTKSLALADLHRPVHLLGPFGLALAFNSGAAFSLFSGAAAVIALTAVVVVALLAVVAWRTQTTGLSVGLGLILGGALGNLADRAFRGHHGSVVDFITLTHWPTFNVADSCITVGALLVAALSFRRPHESAAT